MFTTRHAQVLFQVASPQTIRNWTKEFSSYLSPSATPEKGATRNFSIDDMRVLALVAQLSDEGKSFDVIHAALAAGQRGEPPALSPDEAEVLVAGEIERQLSAQLHETSELAQKLQEELDTLKTEVQPLREDNIRLNARLEDREARIAELTEQLKDAQKEITRLAEEKGDAYIRGLMEALERRGDLPKKSE